MRAQQTALPMTAAAARPGFVSRLARAVSELWRLWSNRRAMRRLSELTDWELIDIGLTREDLVHAYRGRVLDDPTRALEQAARDRARAEAAIRRHP